MMVKTSRFTRKSSLMFKPSKFIFKSEAAIQSCSEVLKMSQKKNISVSHSSSKLAGIQLQTFLKKASVHVFSSNFGYLSCKTSPGDYF